MYRTLLNKLFIASLTVGSLFAGQMSAQDTSEQPVINPTQTKNPPVRVKRNNNQPQTNSAESSQNQTENQTNTEIPSNSSGESRSVANRTLEVVRRANAEAVSPTEIYKVGIGDVLFISLQNAPANTANYFTVLNDGTIDYPLAGEMVQVAGMTTEEIEDVLKTKVKIFENPQISVKLREYASKSITVLGLVEKSGQKFLQREAVPLYVVRAEAIVQPRADTVIVKRANSITERFSLKDPKYENILIFPGDIVEFTASQTAIAETNIGAQFFYIGGNIANGGQKNFTPGMTLTQAILASGGLKKTNARKVVIRRKNENGLLVSTEYNLKDIKDGKIPDPVLQAGDTIEIEN